VADAKQARRLTPDARRRHLLEVSLTLFARQGYSDTDLSDIAEAAGIRRTLLYHYFEGGKESLYVAVLQHAWADLASRMTIDPVRGPGLMPDNLRTYLDLIEAGDESAEVVRQSRRLDLASVKETTRTASRAIAQNMAINQLGMEDPPESVLSVFQAFMAFFEGLLEEWAHGALDRTQVEGVVAITLPAIAAAARDTGS
jgi:AcrR family transcriptional regulator